MRRKIMKHFAILSLMIIMVCSSIAISEPALIKAKYNIPEMKYMYNTEELYGVWKFEYISINGTIYTMDSYLDYAAYINSPDSYEKTEHNAYYIFDGINEAASNDDLFITSAITGILENGKIKSTDNDGAQTISGILTDGNYIEHSIVDDIDVKMIAVREPFSSSLLQKGWLKINTEAGTTYDDFKATAIQEDTQDKQADANIYLVDDPQGITLYLTGDYSMFGSNTLNVDYVIINNSNVSLDLMFDSIVLNGWEINNMLSGTYGIGSKNKKKSNLTIFLNDADISSTTEIKEMVLNFHISDAEKYKILKNYGPFKLTFDGEKWTKKR